MKSTETFFEYPKLNNIKEIIKLSVEKYSENIAFILKKKNGKNVSYEYITYKRFFEQVNFFGTGLY